MLHAACRAGSTREGEVLHAACRAGSTREGEVLHAACRAGSTREGEVLTTNNMCIDNTVQMIAANLTLSFDKHTTRTVNLWSTPHLSLY